MRTIDRSAKKCDSSSERKQRDQYGRQIIALTRSVLRADKRPCEEVDPGADVDVNETEAVGAIAVKVG